MKELLQQLAAYHCWANQRLTACIMALSPEAHTSIFPGSFPSLQATLLHMWNAESIWWQRMKMQEVVVGPAESFHGSTADIVEGLMQQSRSWESWVSTASTASIEHVFHYQNTKREQFKQPIYQMLVHVFNHGTYHRGQLVGLLRNLGVENIPGTDFIIWSRSRPVVK